MRGHSCAANSDASSILPAQERWLIHTKDVCGRVIRRSNDSRYKNAHKKWQHICLTFAKFPESGAVP